MKDMSPSQITLFSAFWVFETKSLASCWKWWIRWTRIIQVHCVSLLWMLAFFCNVGRPVNMATRQTWKSIKTFFVAGTVGLTDFYHYIGFENRFVRLLNIYCLSARSFIGLYAWRYVVPMAKRMFKAFDHKQKAVGILRRVFPIFEQPKSMINSTVFVFHCVRGYLASWCVWHCPHLLTHRINVQRLRFVDLVIVVYNLCLASNEDVRLLLISFTKILCLQTQELS